MSLIVLNVSLPVIIKQPVCLYSEVSQHGVHSGGKTNTRHRISRQNWSRGQMRTRDRLSPGRIMSPPRSQIWASWRWWVITNSRIVFITGRTLRHRLRRERGAGTRGAEECAVYDWQDHIRHRYHHHNPGTRGPAIKVSKLSTTPLYT